MTDQLVTIQELQLKLAEREAEHRRAEKLQTALYEIADAASAVTDIHQFYAKLHSIIGGLMYARNFFIAAYDEQSGMMSWPYHKDEKDTDEDTWAPGPYTEDKGVTSYVLRTGKNVHSSADTASLVRSGELEVIGTLPEDAILVPLTADGKTIGVLCVQSYEKGTVYSEQDVQLLTFVSQHVATALTRARAIEETLQRNNELAIINSVQEGLASKLDYQAIVDLVGDKIRDIFDAQSIGIGRYDHAAGWVDYGYVQQKGRRVHIEPSPFAGMSRYMIDTRRTLVINKDFARRAKEIGATFDTGFDMPRSAVYVPLLVGEAVNGVITLGNLDREHAFSESDVRLLQTLANTMSVALENARLFDEVQKNNREISEALEQQQGTGEILRVIASSPTDIQPVLVAVAEYAARLCQANDVQIYQLDGDSLRQVTHFGPLPALKDGESLPLVPGLVTGRAVLERRTIHIADMRELSKSEYPESVLLQQRLGHRTAISTPLLREGKAIGAIVVRRNEVSPFTAKQIALLATFADQAAIAIENVRLFDETSSPPQGDRAARRRIVCDQQRPAGPCVQAGHASHLRSRRR